MSKINEEKDGNLNFRDVALVVMVVGFLIWFALIVAGKTPDKPSWLMVPLTSIYVIVNIWLANAAIRSANAANASVNIMSETLSEMRFATNMSYAPAISFSKGFKFFEEQSVAKIVVSNLSDRPALECRLLLWEVEKSKDGKVSIKYSSMKESVARDLPGRATDEVFELNISKRPDTEKAKIGDETLERFKNVYQRDPESCISVVVFNNHIGITSVLVYEVSLATQYAS